MKPVFQTIINGERGNCTAAAIASILEIELEDVPNFIDAYNEAGGEYGFSHYINKWLYPTHGLIAFEIPTKGLDCAWDLSWCGNVNVLATVPSQKFKDKFHSVVARINGVYNGVDKPMTIIHDPNPHNDPYPDTTDISWVTVFVKPLCEPNLPE